MFVGEEVASKLDRGAATSNLVTLDCILPLLEIIMVVMIIIIMVTFDCISSLLVIIMVMMIIIMVTLDYVLPLLMIIIMVMIIQEIISSVD